MEDIIQGTSYYIRILTSIVTTIKCKKLRSPHGGKLEYLHHRPASSKTDEKGTRCLEV
jgi:hypothetical protein